MFQKLFAVAALLTLAGISAAQAPAPAAALQRTASPSGAKLYIVSPADGATVKGPVTVVFGLAGMGIAPAGVQFENAGHHHLLVDADLPKDLGMPLPATDNIRHFGKGQTEATLTLPPGKHTLQLVLGDHMHIPFNPVVASPKITITVAP
ncbi:MAG: DUF4399 domain-containing protein [Steroidobacteraceae bacterium]